MSDKPTIYYLQYGNTVIKYTLTYSDRETLAIQLHPETMVAVKAPLESEFPEIEKRARKRAPGSLNSSAISGASQPSSHPANTLVVKPTVTWSANMDLG